MDCVIGPEYCSSNEVDLAVVRQVLPRPNNTIFVGDKNNDVIFEVSDTTSGYGLHWKRELVDKKTKRVILNFRNKHTSLHYRWRVYKGNSKSKTDLIYTAKHSSLFGSYQELEVFLASNKDEKICDFKVEGSSHVFYAGDSCANNIIAETRDGYTVKVCPNVDQAFIISLIVILDGINQQRAETDRLKQLKTVASMIQISNKVYGAMK